MTQLQVNPNICLLSCKSYCLIKIRFLGWLWEPKFEFLLSVLALKINSFGIIPAFFSYRVHANCLAAHTAVVAIHLVYCVPFFFRVFRVFYKGHHLPSYVEQSWDALKQSSLLEIIQQASDRGMEIRSSPYQPCPLDAAAYFPQCLLLAGCLHSHLIYATPVCISVSTALPSLFYLPSVEDLCMCFWLSRHCTHSFHSL